MFRLCVSPVSWVRLFGASVLALFAPNGLQQAPWDVFDRLLANKPELDCPSSHFLNNRTAQRNPYEQHGLTTQESMETARSAFTRGYASYLLTRAEEYIGLIPVHRFSKEFGRSC
jgi:hypothetical protein